MNLVTGGEMRPREFWRWFNEEREKRGLSFRAVEKLGGLSHGAISQREREELPPTYNICVAISRAFRIPLDDVLRKAGLLPPAPDDDPRLKELIHWFSQLDETAQDLILDAIRGIAEQRAGHESRPRTNAGKPVEKS